MPLSRFSSFCSFVVCVSRLRISAGERGSVGGEGVESSSRVVLSERWKGRRTGTSEAGNRREGSRPKKTIGKAGMKCAVGKRRRSRRNEPDGGGGGGGGSVVLFLSSVPGKDGHKSAVSDVLSARYKVKAQHNRQDDTTCSDAVRNADTIC